MKKILFILLVILISREVLAQAEPTLPIKQWYSMSRDGAAPPTWTSPTNASTWQIVNNTGLQDTAGHECFAQADANCNMYTTPAAGAIWEVRIRDGDGATLADVMTSPAAWDTTIYALATNSGGYFWDTTNSYWVRDSGEPADGGAIAISNNAAYRFALGYVWDGTDWHVMGADANGNLTVNQTTTTPGYSRLQDGDGTNLQDVDVDGYASVVDKAYTAGTDSNRVEEIDPLSEHYSTVTLCSLTNIAQGTTDYCGYWDMDGYETYSVHCIASTTPTDTITLTVECSVEDNGTAPAACSYVDVTTSLTELNGNDHNASYTDEEIILIPYFDVPLKYCRVKYVTNSGGGNDQDLECFVKKMY